MTDDELDLPGLLADLARAHGVGAALKLADAFGGREIYVPTALDVSHPIARAIGLAAARWLCKSFGRERLIVPLGPFATGARRRREIMKMVSENRSTSEIVAALRCHQRTVEKTRARMRSADQLDLFPDR